MVGLISVMVNAGLVLVDYVLFKPVERLTESKAPYANLWRPILIRIMLIMMMCKVCFVSNFTSM